jgi:hypothetical protein
LYWIGVKSVAWVLLRKAPKGLTLGEENELSMDDGGEGNDETNSENSSVVGNGLTRISSQSMSETSVVFVLSHGENGYQSTTPRQWESTNGELDHETSILKSSRLNKSSKSSNMFIIVLIELLSLTRSRRIVSIVAVVVVFDDEVDDVEARGRKCH